MSLTDKEYEMSDKIYYQSSSEKCENCNSPYGYHHLCKGKNCKCLVCKERYK